MRIKNIEEAKKILIDELKKGGLDLSALNINGVALDVWSFFIEKKGSISESCYAFVREDGIIQFFEKLNIVDTEKILLKELFKNGVDVARDNIFFIGDVRCFEVKAKSGRLICRAMIHQDGRVDVFFPIVHL
jgi:hypothetical protein